MNPLIIRVEGHAGAKPALFSSHVERGQRIRFTSHFENEKIVRFSPYSPFTETEFSLNQGDNLRKQVRSDAQFKEYPFEIQTASVTSKLRAVVGLSESDGIGFRVDAAGEVIYQVSFRGREVPLVVGLENWTDAVQEVKVQDEDWEVLELDLPPKEIFWLPRVVFIDPRELEVSTRLTVELTGEVAGSRTTEPQPPPRAETLTQAGGTRQVEIIVDPET